MRQRIAWLVAATTLAIILAFVLPLCLLVRTLAEDRALAATRQEAQTVAILVASLPDPPRLGEAMRLAAQDTRRDSAPTTSVLLPDGTVVGAVDPAMGADPLVRRARDTRTAFSEMADAITALTPVAVDSGVAVVRSRLSTQALTDGVRSAWASIGALGAALFTVAMTVAWWLGQRISTPVSALAAVAHRLRTGDFDARAELDGPGEVAELGAAMNLLADRLGELLAAEREAAADLSHRLRTPVTALRLDCDLVPEPELAQRLRDHVEQLQRTIDAVVAEARRPSRAPLPGVCDAVAVVAGRVRFWGPLAEDQARAMTFHAPDAPALAPLTEDDLSDLVDNLIDNVFAHTPDGAALEVGVARGPQGTVTVTVSDAGPGFSREDLLRRGASGSGSTGLGLDIVRRLARSAGGSVQLRPATLGGLEVEVQLGPVRR